MSRASKPSAARAALDKIESKLAEVALEEAKVRAEVTAAQVKADTLRDDVQARIADGGPVGIDVTADDLSTRSMHGDLAAADESLRRKERTARVTLDGLRQRRDRLMSERVAHVRDNLDALVAELSAEAVAVRGRLDLALMELDAVRADWQRLSGAWLALERAGDLQTSMRLDVPAWPVKVGDVVDPVPAAVGVQTGVVVSAP